MSKLMNYDPSEGPLPKRKVKRSLMREDADDNVYLPVGNNKKSKSVKAPKKKIKNYGKNKMKKGKARGVFTAGFARGYVELPSEIQDWRIALDWTLVREKDLGKLEELSFELRYNDEMDD